MHQARLNPPQSDLALASHRKQTSASKANWPALLLASWLTLLSDLAHADTSRATQPACGSAPADPAAAQPETLVRTLYDIVSGPAHQPHDWARLERLHAPGALITPTQHQPQNFSAAPQTLTQFIALNQRLFAAQGFYEQEIAQQVQRFGHIAHVWSAYETRRTAHGPVAARGINSFQLLHDGQRWCVLSATWDSATAEHPVMEARPLESLK